MAIGETLGRIRRRLGLDGTRMAKAQCGTIRLEETSLATPEKRPQAFPNLSAPPHSPLST